MPYNKEIEDRIDNVIARWPNIEKKKMFGGICYLTNGNMCFGIWKDYLIVRAGVETAEEKLHLPFVSPFDVTGKPMKGWIMVAEKGWQSDQELSEWVTIGKEFALSLPSKCKREETRGKRCSVCPSVPLKRPAHPSKRLSEQTSRASEFEPDEYG